MEKPKIVSKVWGEERWVVNRDYCGKILVLNKGFRCSMHHHKNKDETFFVSSGKVFLEVDGKSIIMNPGDVQLVMPNQEHRFTGLENSEIIEFSTHHEDSDSYRTESSGEVDMSGKEWDKMIDGKDVE